MSLNPNLAPAADPRPVSKRELFAVRPSGQSEFSGILKALAQEKTPLLVNGLLEGQKAHLAYLLSQMRSKKQVLVTSTESQARTLYEELEFYLPGRVLFLPGEEIRFYTIDAMDRSQEHQRIVALTRLSKQDYDVLVMPCQALMQRYLPAKRYQEALIDCEVGQSLSPERLTERLLRLGYERVGRIEGKGQMALRGGILDIFSPQMEHPFRLEFFGDEIDSIRLFDAFSQVSIEKRGVCQIYPAREILLPAQTEGLASAVQRQLKAHHSQDLFSDALRLEQGSYFEGMRRYLVYFSSPENQSIFSYLPADALITLSEPGRVQEKLQMEYEQFQETFKIALEKGFALPAQAAMILSKEQVLFKVDGFSLLLHSFLIKAITHFRPTCVISLETRDMISFQGNTDALAYEIKYLQKQGCTVVLVMKQAQNLEALAASLQSFDTPVRLIREDSKDLRLDQAFAMQGHLQQGFIYPKSHLAVITDKEISIRERRSRLGSAPKQRTRRIESFVDLKKGDPVVHETYGIGRFVGIEERMFDDIRKDYLKVIYSGGDALYLPLEQLDKIQKYIGGAQGESLTLSKLGTAQWKKAKARTKKAVEEIARDLVELYARRKEAKGFQFGSDTAWQQQFESLFPYEPTRDQIEAIQDIKGDMESVQPMDRLICGDVGYGKTEVAIRAIFKACMESKQVAFLVPTTILAQQHYETLLARFSGYPIRVEAISRFRSKKEQESILRDLKAGLVDILIGTHRILSSDIAFKDLGLLVIDEEQRFGVRHKETLKKMRENVDVLALSATPIPRTLHMSLSGIRDMSLLEEPPINRHPIMTYVTEAREGIILDAIEREIDRGGQVFFVYNRVGTIEKMASTLSRLVPQARIGIAHGQMTPSKLEDIMNKFLEREFDVLLCTTIIETGLDIGNANTMLIYDADKMGLSQLYQLRGRVGRSSRQAYAYFLYQKDKVLTEVSEKRLKAIREFTEFGSGFKIAMRDLEIRGAGNILGEVQHGHMGEVGYDLYMKMLTEALESLQGIESIEQVDTEVDLPVNAFIPETYIEDEQIKLEMYKRIASIGSKEEALELEEEFVDRFSDPPASVVNLLWIARIRLLGRRLGIEKIRQVNDSVLFETKVASQTLKKKFPGKKGPELLFAVDAFLELMV